MRYIFCLIIASLIFLSCGQNNNKKNEATKKKNSTRDSLIPETQNIQTDTSQATDEIVSQIDAEVNRIKSLSLTKKMYKIKKTDCDIEDLVITYFLDKNEIVKITASSFAADAEGGSTSTKTYYFKNNKFIFSHEDWKSMGGDGPPGGTARIYVHDDKIMRRMENDSILKEPIESMDTDPEEYRILGAYSTKNFASVFCN